MVKLGLGVHVDKIMIGDIMLLIPGIAIINLGIAAGILIVSTITYHYTQFIYTHKKKSL